MTAIGSRDARSSSKFQRSNWQRTNERHAADCQQLSNGKSIGRLRVVTTNRHSNHVVPRLADLNRIVTKVSKNVASSHGFFLTIHFLAKVGSRLWRSFAAFCPVNQSAAMQ